MAEVHSPNVIGPIILNLDPGFPGQTIESTGGGVNQAIWVTPPVTYVPNHWTVTSYLSGGVLDPNVDTTDYYLLGSNFPAIATLVPPSSPANQNVVRLKNIGLGDFVITCTIGSVDGINPFTIKGLQFGGMYSGSNGGECVTLVWNFVLNAWHVIDAYAI